MVFLCERGDFSIFMKFSRWFRGLIYEEDFQLQLKILFHFSFWIGSNFLLEQFKFSWTFERVIHQYFAPTIGRLVTYLLDKDYWHKTQKLSGQEGDKYAASPLLCIFRSQRMWPDKMWGRWKSVNYYGASFMRAYLLYGL